MLNINSIKLINEIKMKKQTNNKASLKLEEIVALSYYEALKLIVHLLPFVVAKLRKLIERDLLGHVPLRVASGNHSL